MNCALREVNVEIGAVQVKTVGHEVEPWKSRVRCGKHKGQVVFCGLGVLRISRQGEAS